MMAFSRRYLDSLLCGRTLLDIPSLSQIFVSFNFYCTNILHFQAKYSSNIELNTEHLSSKIFREGTVGVGEELRNLPVRPRVLA